MPITPSDYKTKVILGIPFSGRYVPPEFAIALATLAWPMNIVYSYVPVKGLPREQARSEIVKVARRLKSQYVAMIDDDIELPRESMMELIHALDERPEYDFIAAVCPSRSLKPEPMVFLEASLGAHWRWKFGEIFEVSEAATACILFRTSIFDKVPEPWFRDLNTLEEQLEDGIVKQKDVEEGFIYGGAMTDDIYFCRKAKAAGCRLLAHGGVLPRHWGRKGDVYELPPDSYPFTGGKEIDLREALLIDGWMTTDELTWLAEQARHAKHIVEIGSWQGRSTRVMAQHCLEGKVLSVDTFDGTGSDTSRDQLVGKPPGWLFEQFRTNMLGLTNVHAMQMTSLEAAAKIPADMKFDMIFIDADHSYEAVKADIEAWKPKLAEGGLLCGHDYKWAEVMTAVTELLPDAKRAVGDIWYVPPVK
jgi:Methyltransferase domain